jgi:hypothetical protein
VREFAAGVDAEVEWVRRSEAGLVVRGFQLDLLVGGLSRSSP